MVAIGDDGRAVCPRSRADMSLRRLSRDGTRGSRPAAIRRRRRKTLVKRPPPTCRSQHQPDRIQHVSKISATRPSPCRLRQQKRGDQRPLLVRHVGFRKAVRGLDTTEHHHRPKGSLASQFSPNVHQTTRWQHHQLSRRRSARRDELEEDAGLGLFLLGTGEAVEYQDMVAVVPDQQVFRRPVMEVVPNSARRDRRAGRQTTSKMLPAFSLGAG